MNIYFTSKEEFNSFKAELLDEIRKAVSVPLQKQWLKTAEVRELLGFSDGTIQNLRINGSLPHTKIGGTIFYEMSDIQDLLNRNKRKRA